MPLAAWGRRLVGIRRVEGGPEEGRRRGQGDPGLPSVGAMRLGRRGLQAEAGRCHKPLRPSLQEGQILGEGFLPRRRPSHFSCLSGGAVDAVPEMPRPGAGRPRLQGSAQKPVHRERPRPGTRGGPSRRPTPPPPGPGPCTSPARARPAQSPRGGAGGAGSPRLRRLAPRLVLPARTRSPGPPRRRRAPGPAGHRIRLRLRPRRAGNEWNVPGAEGGGAGGGGGAGRRGRGRPWSGRICRPDCWRPSLEPRADLPSLGPANSQHGSGSHSAEECSGLPPLVRAGTP